MNPAARSPGEASDEGRAAGRQFRFLFAALYFAEGVPIGFLWWALPSVLREQSMDVAAITALTAALAVPWTLKFLAGPVVDRSVRAGARLRDWILASQLLMGLTLLPLAAFDALPPYAWLITLLLGHACCAAVQDVAIDALCIRTVPPGELGAVNGWMQFGMTAGRALAAAAVPLLIHVAGWQPAIVAVVALIWAPMGLVVRRVREPRAASAPDQAPPPTLRSAFDRTLLPALAVALLAGSGFEAAGALSGPLLVDLGIDVTVRSLFFGAIAPGGLAIGGLLAARSADTLGLRHSVAVGVLGTVSAVLALGAAVAHDATWMSGALHVALLGIAYAAAGFLISASYACFMSVARGPWGATRFSVLMAATNACETGSGLLAGRLVPSIGYGGGLAVLAGLSLLSLPLLRYVVPDGGRTDGEN